MTSLQIIQDAPDSQLIRESEHIETQLWAESVKTRKSPEDYVNYLTTTLAMLKAELNNRYPN
tara:strand:- start:251 stop:436 length:186 start_codon:yes stop_codon:yes gene_type:complete